jgi:hypothetical protein
MKPLLDRMINMIVAGLSGKAKAFYDLEFNFFSEVTSISGKLKPYIKKSKPEKKAKIDEEMARIALSVGVYLPSNPDGTVIDIDRLSGRPLQSHAKAPFMATFKVQKERREIAPDATPDGAGQVAMIKHKYDVWQSAIFKVGDDCRQDVLALQIIAMFKNVFQGIGLFLYLFPYRVTATAPGVSSLSFDMMGQADYTVWCDRCCTGRHITGRDGSNTGQRSLRILHQQVWLGRYCHLQNCPLKLYQIHGGVLGGVLYLADQGPAQWKYHD